MTVDRDLPGCGRRTVVDHGDDVKRSCQSRTRAGGLEARAHPFPIAATDDVESERMPLGLR